MPAPTTPPAPAATPAAPVAPAAKPLKMQVLRADGSKQPVVIQPLDRNSIARRLAGGA